MQVIHSSPMNSQLKNAVISTITNARLCFTEPQTVVFRFPLSCDSILPSFKNKWTFSFFRKSIFAKFDQFHRKKQQHL
jgi:hypothetical protein